MPDSKWEPTKKQTAALEYAQAHDYKYRVDNLSTNLDIGRSTYYGWFSTPAFSAWWLDNWTQHFATHLPDVYATILDKARGESDRGDVSAAKLIVERFDKGYVPQSQKILTGAEGGPMKTYVFNCELGEVTGDIDTREPRAEALTEADDGEDE